jgi:hypothetical protein
VLCCGAVTMIPSSRISVYRYRTLHEQSTKPFFFEFLGRGDVCSAALDVDTIVGVETLLRLCRVGDATTRRSFYDVPVTTLRRMSTTW